MQAKQEKNVETDAVGDKIGRIHLGRQDLNELQTRKMKGLKRGRATDAEEDGAEEEEEEKEGGEGDVFPEDDGTVENGVELKRPRLA